MGGREGFVEERWYYVSFFHTSSEFLDKRFAFMLLIRECGKMQVTRLV